MTIGTPEHGGLSPNLNMMGDSCRYDILRKSNACHCLCNFDYRSTRSLQVKFKRAKNKPTKC